MKNFAEMNDTEREQYIRDDNSRRNSTNTCGCDWCFVLRLLDAERVRADAAEAELAAMSERGACIGGWINEAHRATCAAPHRPDPYLRSNDA